MDKSQKKALRREVRDRERAQAHASLPLSPNEMRAMFDMLDAELPRRGCDHTRALTKAWLEAGGHNVDAVFAWLNDNGGFCDCEVLANSEQYFEEAMRGAGDT
jgi:hypothetical protein